MKRESMVTNTEKLLFDISETLKRIEGNTNPLPFVVSEEIGSVRKESEIKVNVKKDEKKDENKKAYPCKYCGGEHKRPVDIATCAKKHKRKGEK